VEFIEPWVKAGVTVFALTAVGTSNNRASKYFFIRLLSF